MKKMIFKLALPAAVITVMLFIAFYAKNTPPSGKTAASIDGYGNMTLPALIIDAGHGGADGGAVSELGPLRESEINLDIALKLDTLAGFFGVRTVMTRQSETIEYSDKSNSIHDKKAEDTRRRLELINAQENAVLISIHQNKYTSGEPFGAQVLYAGTEGSREFAEDMQTKLVSALNPKNYRAAVRVQDSIYIMKRVKCPAVLIECGFLSNSEEEKHLQTEQYRLKLAAAIVSGYLSYRNNFNLGGINESQNSVLLY